MKHLKRILVFAAVLVLILTSAVFADSPTDEITDYEIHAKVLEDGQVDLTYHIDWLVLDSDSAGPLEWVSVGISNSNFSDYMPLSDNIDGIQYDSSSGCLDIYFKDAYYEGDTASFDFEVIQGSLYEMNGQREGYTLYQFTPGWFNGIAVDRLAVYWAKENTESYQPAGLVMGDEILWETSLSAGDYYTVKVSYPNSAYNFTVYDSSSYGDGGYSDSFGIFDIIGVLFVLAPFIIFGIIVVAISKSAYNKGAGFGASAKPKVTRTKVVYYDTCPSCGAPRTEGKDDCQYCGHTLIKSEEVIKEEEADDEAKKYTTDGTYHYGTDPNTFVRVHVMPVIVPPMGGPRGFGGGGRHGGGCACASGCACACACACAGGGRAGCTNKDFYKTSLKVKQLEKISKE